MDSGGFMAVSAYACYKLMTAFPDMNIVFCVILTDGIAHFQIIIVGILILLFLIMEPHGLSQLWRIVKEKLRLCPFPH